MDGIENRKHSRMSFRTPIELELANPPQNIPQTITGETFDISNGGLGINLKNIFLPAGISGQLKTDIDGNLFESKFKTTWSKNDKDGKLRCGVSFIKLEDEFDSVLNKTINQNIERKRKFVFITNLRDSGDWPRVVYESRFMPKNKKDIALLKNNPGFIIWTQFNVHNVVEGYIIVVLLTGKEILSMPPKEVRSRILKAVLFAQNELKVDYIGIGSYVPSVTKQGEWLQMQPDVKTFLTHGDHLTSWIALEGIRERSGLNLSNSVISIVGASGLLGQPIARMLASEVKKMVLIGRNTNKLLRLKETIMSETKDLHYEPEITTDVSAIKDSDLVVSVTSSTDSIIKEEYLKYNAVIYDLAQPMDVGPEICTNRTDVLKIDGGFVTIPGIDLGINLGTPKGSAFACLGDTILQCLENTKRSFVGPVDPEWVIKMGTIAQRYGFKHVAPSCFSWPIPCALLNKTKFESERETAVI